MRVDCPFHECLSAEKSCRGLLLGTVVHNQVKVHESFLDHQLQVAFIVIERRVVQRGMVDVEDAVEDPVLAAVLEMGLLVVCLGVVVAS